jgi:hypothetical protein
MVSAAVAVSGERECGGHYDQRKAHIPGICQLGRPCRTDREQRLFYSRNLVPTSGGLCRSNERRNDWPACVTSFPDLHDCESQDRRLQTLPDASMHLCTPFYLSNQKHRTSIVCAWSFLSFLFFPLVQLFFIAARAVFSQDSFRLCSLSRW